MPQLIQCTSCSKKLRVPDTLAGKKVKCPSCGSTFMATMEEEELPTAPLIEEPAPRRRPAPPPPDPGYEVISEEPRRRKAPPPPPPEEEEEAEFEEKRSARPRSRKRAIEDDYEEDEEEERPRQSARANWSKVRTGVTLVLISVLIFIASIAVLVIGGLIAAASAVAVVQRAANQPPGMPVQPPAGQMMGVAGGMLVVVILAGLMRFAAEVLALVGYIFCMNASPKHGAKTLAIVTLALGGGTLLFFLANNGLMLTGRAAAPGGGMNVVGSGPVTIIADLLNLARFIVSLFFLRAVALCLRDWSLEKSAKTLIILWCIFAGMFVTLLTATIVFAAGAVAAAAGGGGAPGAGIAGAGLLIMGCGCIDLLLFLVAVIWYIVVLVQTRTALAGR
jgi:phage FluMu protein Com